jgi:hypothetical protein
MGIVYIMTAAYKNHEHTITLYCNSNYSEGKATKDVSYITGPP